jgi:hypothetical protein
MMKDLRFFTAVTMKNAVFWDIAPCGSSKNRCRLLGTANVVPRSTILVTPMMEVMFPPKRLLLQEAHDVTFQNTAFFVVFLI